VLSKFLGWNDHGGLTGFATKRLTDAPGSLAPAGSTRRVPGAGGRRLRFGFPVTRTVSPRCAGQARACGN
jgi:hypothetical protein